MKKLSILIFLGILPVLAFSQPANDDCVNRTTIAVTTTMSETVSVDLSTATASAPQLLTDCETSAAQTFNDVWYEFTMPVNGNIRITFAAGTEGFTLYDACGGAEIRCVFGGGYFYDLTATSTYVLRYSERDLFANVSDFEIQAFATSANNECASLNTITVTTAGTTTTSTDFREATASTPQLLTGCETNASQTYHDVWYEFTMPVDGNVRITAADGTEGVTLYDACGGTEIGCVFGGGYFYNLTAATTYILRYSERDIFTNFSNFDIQAFSTIANDECVNRETIAVTTGGTTTVSADLREASASTPQLLTSCETNASHTYADVWYEFTMPVDGNVRITAADGTEGVTLYDACGGVEIGCVFGGGYFYDLTAAATYILRYSERDIFTNFSDFDIQAFSTIANDECANLETITVTTAGTTTVSADFREASASTPQLLTNCETNANHTYHDVWYEFTMPVNGNVRITASDGTEGVTLYDACGGVEIGCVFGGGYFYELTATTTYVLRYSERDIFTNFSDFEIQAFSTIANDECANLEAITVTTAGTTTVSADFREATPSNPQLLTSCETNVNHTYIDVWYEFTMPVDGNIRITASDGTEGVTLYDACGGAEIGCVFGGGYFYDLTATSTYVLRYSERDIFSNFSNFDMQAFSEITNDECIDAEIINVGVVAPTDLVVELRGASESLDSSCENASQIYHDAWYEITMPVNGNLEVTNLDGIEEATLYDACGGTELDCFFNSGTFFNLTSGTTYFLRVSERNIFTNELTFSVQAIEAPLAACAATTEFVAGAWNNGAPDITTNAIIRSNYNTAIHGSFTACSLAIDLSRTLTVSSGDYVEVAFDITVTGTLDIAHQSSLVQRDDSSITLNNGTINVGVTTPSLDGRDFMLMGSPMSGETTSGVFGGAERIRNHLTANFTPNTAVAATSPGAGNWLDEEGDDWPVYTGAINVGEGYLVMRSVMGPATALTLNFNSGTLNNGEVLYPAEFNTDQNSSPNIIANPYASPILADDFINTNSAIVDAVYFWEHKTAPSSGLPGPYGLDYTMEDISIYNLTGGTSAAGSDPTTTPNGVISAAQGFGIKALVAGDITFNNSMRRITGNTTLRGLTERDRIWLNVQADRYELNGTTLIGFIDEATDGLDLGYDSRRLANNVALYSHLVDGSDQLGIQARSTFQENVKIPMGFSTLVDETISYTISIENIEGLNLANQTVYLIDHQEQTIANLTETNYTFVSAKGIFDGRFTLQFTPETILANETNTIEEVVMYPNPSKGMVTISSPNTLIERVEVRDMLGRVIRAQSFSGDHSITLDVSKEMNATYFISIITSEGIVLKRLIKE